jgi:ATP-dependent DNA helicase DinG
MSQVSAYIKNFPFPTLREKQSYVLKEIDAAFASGYNQIIVEAPTGFGKSPVAIATALTLGSSYILTSTKNLQTQYARDFTFVRVAKGKNNFRCEVKDDFIKNGTFRCKPCGGVGLQSGCHHTSVDYGPCMSDEHFDCKYKTNLKDYKVIGKGAKEEVLLVEGHYQNAYSKWYHLNNLREDVIRDWRPCQYFHQLNISLAAAHSVLNYAIFLGLVNKKLPSRELLIFDEAHLLETEIVRFREIAISRRKWRKYIPDLRIDNHGYEVEGWVSFLDKLRDMMLNVKIPAENKELLIEAEQDIEKLELTIESISLHPDNWIVSEITLEGLEVVKVELKPLDVSPYCKSVFTKCNKSLMMSATILDSDTFCKGIGLEPDDVKVIHVGSDFPLQNTPIYPLNVAYLNYAELHKDAVKRTIAGAIDRIMTEHKDHKGIIHTTSYEQLHFIKENISKENKRRLLETDPEVQRDEIIKEHIDATKPTVLISPSLHLGLDLKDDLSRFQVITKVPYPSLGDRWIDEKRKRNERWYKWQTALRLVQGYGRSVRSKDDWATTYVIDSAFGPFVRKNKNILPHWFIQAIQPHLDAPLGQAPFETVKVLTPSEEHRNKITINHHNPTNIPEQNESSFYIPKLPQQSETLASLDEYNKVERSVKPERLFICPYCSKFSSTVEREYQRHIVLKHRGKSGYPDMSVEG